MKGKHGGKKNLIPMTIFEVKFDLFTITVTIKLSLLAVVYENKIPPQVLYLLFKILLCHCGDNIKTVGLANRQGLTKTRKRDLSIITKTCRLYGACITIHAGYREERASVRGSKVRRLVCAFLEIL